MKNHDPVKKKKSGFDWFGSVFGSGSWSRLKIKYPDPVEKYDEG